MAESTIASLDTPHRDMAAGTATITIITKGESLVGSVFLDSGDTVAEVIEENNEVKLARQ